MRRGAIDRVQLGGVVMHLTKTKGDTMSEFIGTMLLVGIIGAGTYYIAYTMRSADVRYWAQRAMRAEKIADEMGRSAMENYVDLAIAELKAGK